MFCILTNYLWVKLTGKLNSITNLCKISKYCSKVSLNWISSNILRFKNWSSASIKTTFSSYNGSEKSLNIMETPANSTIPFKEEGRSKGRKRNKRKIEALCIPLTLDKNLIEAAVELIRRLMIVHIWLHVILSSQVRKLTKRSTEVFHHQRSNCLLYTQTLQTPLR